MKEPKDFNLMHRMSPKMVYALTKAGYQYAEDPITIPLIGLEVKGCFYKVSGSIANMHGIYILGMGTSFSLAKEVAGDSGMHKYLSFYEYSLKECGYIEEDHESIAYKQALVEKFIGKEE